MHPLTNALLNLLGSLPDAEVAVVHPDDYRDHLRQTLGGRFMPTTSQATLTAGCAGHFSREGGKLVALYLRRSVDRGSVRVGTVSMLKELRR